MRFLDSAKIFVCSGAGGGGGVSFRREKFIPRGGPDGGNGGRGGSVYVRAVDNLNTLIDYRYRQHFRAGTGETGKGGNRHGKKGHNVTLEVPLGTQIFDEDGIKMLHDLTEAGSEALLLPGERGGRGNAMFKSATNQAPRYAEKGGEAKEAYLWLKLKLLADIGLIGMPNAGKSSLLNTLTMAKSKVGDYPFTTLYPSLGVLRLPSRDCILADIPGLIAGAHEGKGLGHRFLGHVERCSVVVHLLDVSEENLVAHYRTVRHELKAYSLELLTKPESVWLSKCDYLDTELLDELEATLNAEGIAIAGRVSSVAGGGTQALINWLTQYYHTQTEMSA
ncbi:MAG: GTPase ObgE [Alphaproteobacteria bacterium]|nr:GTPase ObgE [Alphaproteobacteria bacterium]